MRYPVVIHKDAKSSYGITVPDLPGVFTAGDSAEEALANLQEAVEAAYDGEPGGVPPPSTLETHLDNPDFAGGVFALADVDLGRIQGPAVRINITLPQRDLDAIDRAARDRGSNRSNFLRDAALALIRNTAVVAVQVREQPHPGYGATVPAKSKAKNIRRKR